MGRGRLLFKGDEKPKKKKKQSKHEIHTAAAASTTAAHSRAEQADPPSAESKRAAVSAPLSAAAAPVTSESSKPSASAASASAAAGPKIQQGKGEIVTSGTVVTGFDTIFTRQINPGDALLVQIPHDDGGGGGGGGGGGEQEEMRVVTMRLSDTSINLSSGFSQNLATPTPFRFIAKPGNNRSKSLPQSKQQQQHAHGTDADGAAADSSDHRELVYRERTEHGSYRIRRVQLDQEVTRGTLLEMRAKKKSDKYC